MADLKKVIQGLRCCDTRGCNSACPECPYNESDYCTRNLNRDINKLLKENEPAKPVKKRFIRSNFTPNFYEVIDGKYVDIWCCGKCKSPLGIGAVFCEQCGKEVDWHGVG